MQWSGNPFFLESYLGILESYHLILELNPLPNYSGIDTKVVAWIILLRVDSTILSVDFHSETKWSLIWLLKEWISTPVHLESRKSPK